MPGQKEDITLYGERAERFRDLREELTDYLGYEPTKPEAIGLIMTGWTDERDAQPNPTPKER